MSLEDNKHIARQFHACNMDGYGDLISEDFVGHDNLGHTWDKAFQIAGLRADTKALEGLHDTIHEIVAEGDSVAVRFTRSGIFNAKYEDEVSSFEPTHKEAKFPVMELLHFSNGRIVGLWAYNDDSQAERILKGEA